MISKVIQQVVRTGYLSAEVEEQIRFLFSSGCTLDELDALIDLQDAIVSGRVKRESERTEKIYILK